LTDQVAFDPNNSTISKFLGALALGETGGSSYAVTEGVGGANLSSSSVDQYGFPNWEGSGNSHAAGIFQFQPGTWDSIASQQNLNFSNASDQEAGAWALAQQTYSSKTGRSLYADLSSGNMSSLNSALASVWPSVMGNEASPQGLASAIANGQGIDLGSLSSSSSSANGGTGATAQSGGIVSDIENWFVRFGLIIVGGLVVLIALWALLSQQGIVPPPQKVAGDVGKALAV